MSKDLDWTRHPTPVIALERCDGCGKCIEVCPTGALALIEGKARVVRAEDCDYTGLCEMVCPTEAIARQFEIVVVDGPSRWQIRGVV